MPPLGNAFRECELTRDQRKAVNGFPQQGFAVRAHVPREPARILMSKAAGEK